MNNRIRNAAFIYLSQSGGSYYLSDELSYSIQRRPALGLQYLCAVLERKNIKTNIFDQTVNNFSLDDLIERLKDYDMAGFYCSDAQEAKVKDYCRKIKAQLDIPILVGGPSTLADNSFLNNGCDILVFGEGEITIQQIVEYYNFSLPIDNVKGISYKHNGRILKTQPQKLIENLDELPFPDRSKIDINAYYDYFLFSMKKPYATMMTSRGCLYACHFCTTHKIWEHKFRRRSPDNVISEIDELVEKYKVKYISFQDDIFVTPNSSWVEEFCEKLIKRPYRIKWMAVLHPFSIARGRERVLKLMKRAGCDALSFGLQSAHAQVLKGINRNPLEPEKLKELLKIANKLKLITLVFYIFGLPRDTKETIKTSLDYSLSCGSTLANYFTLTILKGSELERLYGSNKTCALTQEEITKLTVYASRKFYTNPKIIFRIAYFILKHPGWLLKVSRKLPGIFARIGFGKTKK